MEVELAGLLVVDRGAGDVAGQQVRRTLEAAEVAAQGAGERLGEQRLGGAGDVLHQQVAVGQ